MSDPQNPFSLPPRTAPVLPTAPPAPETPVPLAWPVTPPAAPTPPAQPADHNQIRSRRGSAPLLDLDAQIRATSAPAAGRQSVTASAGTARQGGTSLDLATAFQSAGTIGDSLITTLLGPGHQSRDGQIADSQGRYLSGSELSEVVEGRRNAIETKVADSLKAMDQAEAGFFGQLKPEAQEAYTAGRQAVDALIGKKAPVSLEAALLTPLIAIRGSLQQAKESGLPLGPLTLLLPSTSQRPATKVSVPPMSATQFTASVQRLQSGTITPKALDTFDQALVSVYEHFGLITRDGEGRPRLNVSPKAVATVLAYVRMAEKPQTEAEKVLTGKLDNAAAAYVEMASFEQAIEALAEAQSGGEAAQPQTPRSERHERRPRDDDGQGGGATPTPPPAPQGGSTPVRRPVTAPATPPKSPSGRGVLVFPDLAPAPEAEERTRHQRQREKALQEEARQTAEAYAVSIQEAGRQLVVERREARSVADVQVTTTVDGRSVAVQTNADGQHLGSAVTAPAESPHPAE